MSRGLGDVYKRQVETFVDPSRFAGTSYRAAGWIAVGQTKGFAKTNRTYRYHGQPKTVFVRPLHRRALTWLKDPMAPVERRGKMSASRLSSKQTDALIECLRKLPDPRKRRGIRHGKLSVLSICICAVLSGARSFAAISEWGQRCSQPLLRRLCCRRSPRTQRYEAPSEPTIRRLLQTIDAQAVDDALGEWLAGLCSCEGQDLAIDGKTLKGARRPDGSQVKLLSAFLHQQGTTVAQQEIAPDTNEIPVLKPLLAPLDIEGSTVTADAIHAQTDSARFLVEEKKADYFFTVKDNQPQLKKDIELLDLKNAFPPSGPNDR